MALNEPWLFSESDNNVDQEVVLQSIENMNSFLLGNNLRKSVLSYVLSRKIFEDKNDELTKLFQSIDKDKNGYIDENEFFDFYSKFFPGTLEEQMIQIRQIIESIDINNSKKIDYTEF